MQKFLLKNGLGWGMLVWLFGYVLSIALFKVVPPHLLGWIITPFGVLFALWVLFKKAPAAPFKDFVALALAWTAIAALFDYLFIVKAFQPEDYYKLDVYLYYALTFVLPLVAAKWKRPAVAGG